MTSTKAFVAIDVSSIQYPVSRDVTARTGYRLLATRPIDELGSTSVRGGVS